MAGCGNYKTLYMLQEYRNESEMDVAPHPLTMFKLILNEGQILDINALRSIKSWHQIYGN